MTRDAVTNPFRLFSLLGRRDHALLLYAGASATDDDVPAFERVAEAAVAAAHGRIEVYLVAAPEAAVDATVLPLIRDSADEFARNYLRRDPLPRGVVDFCEYRRRRSMSGRLCP